MVDIKVTDQELETVKQLQERYSTIIAKFGQIKIEKILITAQLKTLTDMEHDLELQHANIQEDEKKLVAEFNKKYGDGELNIDTGIFSKVE